MNRPIRRLAVIVFAGFGLLVAAVTWLQVIEGPRYRDDDRNARVALSRVGRERGGIVTADGVVLATSVADADDPRAFRREYPEGELYGHVVGYSSLLFGDTALEEARASALTSGRSCLTRRSACSSCPASSRPWALASESAARMMFARSSSMTACGVERGAAGRRPRRRHSP